MGKHDQREGWIFKIKRFSIHDGPGIRTSVFMKGCPLKCVWCHNPEGINPDISIWYNRKLCIACGQCVEVCPTKALKLTYDPAPVIKIDKRSCHLTGECINTCPTNALQFTGYKTTIDESIREIEKDLAYYQISGGGVTLTGGEPLYQAEFSSEILKACKQRNINTAIETSLYCEKDIIDRILPYVDLFIVDLKIFDPSQHTLFTGRSNENIIENFRHLAASEKTVLVRIPLIVNITDTNENKAAITNFVFETNEKIQVEYINFNPLTENKYIQLELPYLLKKEENSNNML
ncbi:MAG: hypothetical protein A2X05_17810 [Bacteroidetes bacterium GWE2_41_25]|nr:MAG: hypothetical protein A2X05_17810 [Bacteroidetes bacterium GWE2_41_25]HAM09873.1 glycyl-radical enzyme activating protein [Bacteroidales bacterium]HCU19678.1 glycyl-radical enzyme activating protein [Bacteroidales bacterium]